MKSPTNVLPGIKSSLQGRYRCVLNEGTDREVDTGWFENLLTDIGLDRLAITDTCIRYSSIGTGTTAPANSNTTLQAFVAQVDGRVGDSNSNSGTPLYIASAQWHYVYAQGAVVGNMAEVGIGWGTGGTNLFSRALILDGLGAPTTLTVTSLDQLTVYYELNVTPTLTDATGTVTLATIVYNYTARIAFADLWLNALVNVITGFSPNLGYGGGAGGFGMQSYATQTLGAITSSPASLATFGSYNGAIVVGSYTAGQKYLDSTYTALPAQCNSSGGIGSILFLWSQSQMQYQYSFAAASGGATIPKDNTKTLAFTIRMSWDRA